MKKRFGQRKGCFVLRVILILAVLAMIIITAVFVFARVRTTVRSFARSEVENLAVEAIHNSVREAAANGVDYNELVNITRDTSGKIQSLSLNANRVNKLKSDIALKTLEYLNENSQTLVKIPLGNFTGWELMTGVGPRIKVKIMPNTIANVDFVSNFTQAGINQVLHRLSVKITVNVSAYLPNYTDSQDITSTAIVNEAVIVGDVPNTYLNLGEKIK